MKDYFIIEIFPKLGHSFTDIEGQMKFNFEKRECALDIKKEPCELKIATGSQGFTSFPQYCPTNLYAEKNHNETNPFTIVEKICDVLSLATGNHIAYFTSRISEYSHFSGWGITKELPLLSHRGSLKHRNSNSIFLDLDLLNKIIEKVKSPQYKARIMASLHMNRLAKYKAFSHITEAITDCVNSLEALYMQEKNNRQDNIDKNIIPNAENKTKAMKQFLNKYYTGNKNDLDFIKKIDPYKIRSAYLHRGELLEPTSGDISYLTVTLEGSEKFLTYNNFYKVVLSTILNFVLNAK